MKYTFLIVLCSLILLQSVASPWIIKDYLNGAKDDVTGALKDAWKYFPSFSDLFGYAKNVIAGYPLEYVTTAINTVCSALKGSGSIKSRVMPDITKMHLQLITSCVKYNIPITRPSELLNVPAFDINKKTVFLVTGWRTTINSSETIVQLSKAFNCRGGYNFIAIDADSSVDTLFSWAALNTEKIGEFFGEGLVLLSSLIPLENIHLVGHSLGAHICGAAARAFNLKTGLKIPRISALDPAKPCFNEGESLSGLMRGDADFIDVIHTNPGVLGKREPTGNADFYPDGVVPLPTGCYSVICAHERSWLYFVETIYPGNEYNFMAKRCNSLQNMKQGKCAGIAVPMGLAAPSHLEGNYFLEVRNSPPFGLLGDKNREQANVNCGKCPNDKKFREYTLRI